MLKFTLETFIMLYMYEIYVCVFIHILYILYVISARLPFQTLSASKSPNSTNNVPNKKKRKVASPLAEFKNSKIIKYAKENSTKSISEDKEEETEEKPDTDSECVEIILDQDKKDLEQSSEQDHEKIKKIDIIPKRSSLKKKKLHEKSQKKSGSLTKFFMKADNEPTSDIIHDTNPHTSKNEQDCQNTLVLEGESEVPSNLQSVESPSPHASQVNEEKVNVLDDSNISPESDSDVAVFSDTEVQSELDKSRTSINEEKIRKPTTPKSDKDAKMKTKKLTPKQLEKRQEIVKKKEERARLRMVCYYT